MGWHQRTVVIGLAAVAGVLAAVRARLASARKAPPRDRAEPEVPPRRAQPELPPPRGGTADGAPLSRDELYEEAKRLDIPGRSRMKKAELEAAIAQRAKGGR